jgi:hypothetical protein
VTPTAAPNHGWQFEVGIFSGNPTPIYDMGAFAHEACMIDPRTGYIYETEDDRAAGENFTAGERLIGLTLDGHTFTFAQNNSNLTAAQISAAGKSVTPGSYTEQAWAGAHFSPDGKWLFVNIHWDHLRYHGSLGQRSSLIACHHRGRLDPAALGHSNRQILI